LPSGFPGQHRAKIRSTNPRGRRHLSKRSCPHRLVGTLLLEQNDEWAVQRARHMTLETIAPMSNDPIVRMPALAT
jgi:putative transposase